MCAPTLIIKDYHTSYEFDNFDSKVQQAAILALFPHSCYFYYVYQTSSFEKISKNLYISAFHGSTKISFKSLVRFKLIKDNDYHIMLGKYQCRSNQSIPNGILFRLDHHHF